MPWKLLQTSFPLIQELKTKEEEKVELLERADLRSKSGRSSSPWERESEQRRRRRATGGGRRREGFPAGNGELVMRE